MMLFIFLAIFVSVQCALQEYSKIENFDLEELRKEVMYSQNDLRARRNSDKQAHVHYAIGYALSQDFYTLIPDILVPYLEEKTCIEFHSIERDKLNTVDRRFAIVFVETKDTLKNCFQVFRAGHPRAYRDYPVLTVILNEKCARQKVKDRRAGKTDSRKDLSDRLSWQYHCK